jgi:hypothetical protein
MFDYPLPIPRHTHYEELGIAPEATPDEIREAKESSINRLVEQRNSVLKALKEVYRHVPALEGAYRDVEKPRNNPDSTEAEELRQSRKKLTALEQKALKIRPDYRELRGRLEKLDSAERRINIKAFDNPEARTADDEDNPPLTLLKLADCAEDKFYDNRVAMDLIRRELTDFLEMQGETVYHPSDLTRRDFTTDFTPNELLDGVDDGKFNL